MNFRIIFKHYIYFSFCIYNIFSLAKKCDYVETFKEHLQFYKNSEEFSHYIPRQSCFICVQPACFHRYDKCEQNELKGLPFYHNMLEFGFLGNDLPSQANIRIPLSKNCYFLIEMNRNIGQEIEFNFWQCFYSNNDCTSYYNIPSQMIRESDCIFVSVMLNRKSYNKIYVSVSYDCINLASAIRTSKTNQRITSEECHFRGLGNDEGKFPTIHFKLNVESDSRHEGSVLVVPCSPGGYAVSPINGRFVYDYHCKTLFFPEVHGDSLEEIIRFQYSSEEHVQFPIKEGPHDYTEEGLRPIYIDKDGCPIAPSEMQPKRKVYDSDEKPFLLRDRCDLYQKLPYTSIEEAINSNNVLSTKRLEISTEPRRENLSTTATTTTTTTSATTTTTTTTSTTTPIIAEITITSTSTLKLTTLSVSVSKPEVTTPEVTPQKVTTLQENPTIKPPPTPPGGTFLPEVEQVKERVVVSLTNGSSKTLILFKSKKGVFAKTNTLVPGEKPPPTPKIPLWIPDYEDLMEARDKYRKRKRKGRKANFSRHHTPSIQIRKKPRIKRDIIFERFDSEKNRAGFDYFEYLNYTEYDINGSNILKLTVPWVCVFLLFGFANDFAEDG